MQDYLIIKLQGAMQAWGGHTYEDYRPSLIFPTRSGIVGLLGACLGIEREDIKALKALDKSFQLTVRTNKRKISQRESTEDKFVSMQKITDFHTVQHARKVDGKPRPEAIVSRREYLCDAEFTLAMAFVKDADYGLEQVKQAIQKPVYTPFLGRRSCPIQSRLYEAIVNAENAQAALIKVEPYHGTLYSEIELDGGTPMMTRDQPLFATKVRQFNNRKIYILGSGGEHVPE
ncbi:type I-E CRISPR-associated protein Cas5/CasD [Methylobacter tundripaludum]|uniref:CRISPR-associated protein Cas5 family n=1 Tax=Methylobacter tundripaludum (strain ATCC BAA-1195 / DSM 17260 / SV96) TaxID=697282 RepID=G3IX72_METTV|nr:type I-E CRISPR-associated protein Cas5/CasD [Methylobacter tundripaludum]EGW22009.1 CRISPR-associated protein Cas5 family [Methylobacter tundripaludum SV96]